MARLHPLEQAAQAATAAPEPEAEQESESGLNLPSYPESPSRAGPWWMSQRETTNQSGQLLPAAGNSGLPPLHAQPFELRVQPIEAQQRVQVPGLDQCH